MAIGDVILDMFLYYLKLEFSELHCGPGQKTQAGVVPSGNAGSARSSLHGHELARVVPVRCLTFHPQPE